MSRRGAQLAAAIIALFFAAAVAPSRAAAVLTILARTIGLATSPPDELLQFVAVPLRGLLFFGALWVCGSPILRELRESRLVSQLAEREVRTLAATAFAILALLQWPVRATFVGEMGLTYARMSVDPFAFDFPVYAHRILLPAIAHLLQLKGHLLYWLFSMALLGGLLLLLALLITRTWPAATWREQLLGVVSIGSTGMVMTAFVTPGYADTLMFACVLLLLLADLSDTAILCLAAVALTAHELAVVPLGAVLLARSRWSMLAGLAVLAATYAVALELGQGLGTIMAVHTGGDALGPALAHRWRLLAGIAFAFKLLWLAPLVAMVGARGRGERRVSALAGAAMLIPVVLAFVGTDTTRFAAFGGGGLLVALATNGWAGTGYSTLRNVLLAANVAVPFVTWTTPFGPFWAPGLYDLVIRGLLLL